jgi:ectoine hydroxylase-related dioxygenase (phytanoyl-CoA dioxygenase family)
VSALGAEALAQYLSQGFLAPLPAIGPAAAAAARAKLEAFERAQGHALAGSQRHKSHLLFTWLDEMIRHPAILAPVAAILGPDLLVWNTNFFVKEPGDRGFVSWHQDSTYWGLSEPSVLTAWVAFSPATRASGCMRVVPGSHLRDQLPHRERADARNLLSRGQEVAVDVDEARAVDLELRSGEMSLHHVRIVHGSEPNVSEDRRIGFAIRYVPTRLRQIHGRDSATLVSGEDRYGHFDPEPRPRADCDADALAAHAEVMRRHTELVMAGSVAALR